LNKYAKLGQNYVILYICPYDANKECYFQKMQSAYNLQQKEHDTFIHIKYITDNRMIHEGDIIYGLRTFICVLLSWD